MVASDSATQTSQQKLGTACRHLKPTCAIRADGLSGRSIVRSHRNFLNTLLPLQHFRRAFGFLGFLGSSAPASPEACPLRAASISMCWNTVYQRQNGSKTSLPGLWLPSGRAEANLGPRHFKAKFLVALRYAFLDATPAADRRTPTFRLVDDIVNVESS